MGASLRGAGRHRRRNLEVDIFGKSLDETPGCRKRGSAGEGGPHATVIERRDHTDGAHDVPVLFDQAFVGLKPVRGIFNEARIEHVQNLGLLRCSRSCVGPVF